MCLSANITFFLMYSVLLVPSVQYIVIEQLYMLLNAYHSKCTLNSYHLFNEL